MIGPGRPIDTDRYFVISSNVLGGCRGSTGPSSVDPATGRPYGARFPVVTIADMVNAQARLLDRLGVERLLSVVGGSMGAYQAIEWSVAHPDRVRSVISLAGSARSTAQMLAWNAIGRHAIMSDPRWRGGDYYGSEPPRAGLAVARMIAHVTYVSDQLLERKFGRELMEGAEPRFVLGPEYDVEGYLNYQGARFNDRFDANSYLYIIKAMDYWDLPRQHGSLDAALARSRASWLLASFTSDWLYPTSESTLIADSLRRVGRPCEHLVIESGLGHDAFLIEVPKLAAPVSRFLAAQR
jgi:homoserine O-acetyltransferase